MRSTNIVEDIMSSTFLNANSRSTYIRYIRAGQMMIKQKGELPFFCEVGKNALAARTLGFTHPDYPSLHICSEESALLMFQAADEFFKKKAQACHFPRKLLSHANCFYRDAKALHD